MAASDATPVDDYVAALPDDRRSDFGTVLKIVRDNLPPGLGESMQFGMVAWCVPLARYPDTYNGAPLMVAALAAQKRHFSLYLHSVYCDPETAAWFLDASKRTGRKLDMGKSCVRFRRAADLPLDLVGEAIARTGPDDYIAAYEKARGLRS